MQRYVCQELPGNPKVRFCVAAFLNGHKRVLDSLKCLIYSILCQTHDNCEIIIAHDGPLLDSSIAPSIRAISDKITFLDNLPYKGCWGMHHRHFTAMIEPHADWIVFTNQDNYYTPEFVKICLSEAAIFQSGMVFCDIVHSQFEWCEWKSELRVGGIDLGSFITRMDLVQTTPWTGFHHAGDGEYVLNIMEKTKPHRAKGLLFVHN